jgi:hypothetical protein
MVALLVLAVSEVAAAVLLAITLQEAVVLTTLVAVDQEALADLAEQIQVVAAAVAVVRIVDLAALVDLAWSLLDIQFEEVKLNGTFCTTGF